MVATRARGLLAVALLVGTVAVPAAFVGGTPTVAAAPAAFVPASTIGTCLYPAGAENVTGSLSVEGGGLGPQSIAGVSLTLGYSVSWELVDPYAGAVLARGCAAANESVATGPAGSFSDALALPASVCRTVANTPECTEYTGAYGPLSLSDAQPPPAGYAFSSQTADNGEAVRAEFVWELASVGVLPDGSTVTVSPNAPTEFNATAFMANGSPTPLLPSFRWTVNGTGWTVLTSSGPTAVLEGSDGSGPATLTVVASAAVGAVTETARTAVALAEVPTEIVSASVDRTETDVGEPSGVTVDGTGAAGYAYRAVIDPGLGVAPVPAPCSAVPDGVGTVALVCAASVTYALAGTAQPSAELSNGFSHATWTFPTVTVQPRPLLAVDPAVPAGYAGVPVSIELGVVNGSGVSPFAPACLDPGFGGPECASDPGPTWTFLPTFAAPGTYAAKAWTTDQAGTNASAAFSVRVFPAPALGPLALSEPNVTVGEPVTVEAALAGGALPARLFWNVSDASSPWATASVPTDGAWSAVLLPQTTGPLVVTLTAVDALGTVVRAATTVSVAPAPAVRVVASTAAPDGSVVVGTGVRLAYAAVDPFGNPVASFAAPAELTVTGPSADARLEVNASVGGPLALASDGRYGVPASAWVDGELDLSIVPAAAGSFSVGLSTAQLGGSSSPTENFTATPDLDHVRLFAPSVVEEGGRSNATFWLVEDRFGNPAPGALLTVRTVVGSTRTTTLVAAVALPNGSSGVWVNFTASGSGAGTFEVVDRAGVAVLGPWAIPAAPAPLPFGASAGAVFLAVVGVTVGLGLFAAVRRPRDDDRPPTPVEEELRRFAEGRFAVVALLRRLGPSELRALEGAWRPPPSPPELAEWIASLVADGSVGATVGPDRTARFVLTDRAEPPRIEVDPTLFEEGLRRRDEVGVAD